MAERVLVTFLGIKHRPTTYQTAAGPITEAYAAIALVRECPTWPPDRVIVCTTPEAEVGSLPGLVAVAREAGLPELETVHLSNAEDLPTTIEEVVQAIPQQSEVRLDLTHGFRHLALLAAPIAALLEHTRGVRVVGLHYGMMNGPLLELSELVEIPSWWQAVGAYRSSGSTTELARLMMASPLDANKVVPLTTALRDLDRAWRAGLPLEVGYQAHLIRQRQKTMKTLVAERPFLSGVVEQLAAGLDSVALDIPQGQGRGDYKRKRSFDPIEEERQLRMVARYRTVGQVAQAVSLAREWLVSKAVADPRKWLGKQDRRMAASRLSSLVARQKLGLVTEPDAQYLADVWERLRDNLRNYIMHAGMRKDDALERLEDPSLLDALEAWRGCPLPLPEPSEDAWLVAPVGKAYGSVFTAIRRVSEGPDRTVAGVLLVGSRETLAGGREALQQAGFDGSVDEMVVEDPFADYGAALAQVRDVKRGRHDGGRIVRQLAHAKEVLVCATGGTTLLGVVAGRLGAIATHCGVPVQTFAVADRRPVDEQIRDPFVAGELHWIDAP